MDGSSLTEQLQLYSGGDREIADTVIRRTLPTLHRIAARELNRERYLAPLSPTELINEIWLSSLRKGGWTINSREHFYAIAASAMRRVLIDCARNRLAARRGGGEAVLVALDEDSSKDRRATSSPEAVITVGLLMDRLEATDMGAARIVDMHYFAGFTFEEIAEITGLSRRQVWLRWAKGLKWLRGRYQS